MKTPAVAPAAGTRVPAAGSAPAAGSKSRTPARLPGAWYRPRATYRAPAVVAAGIRSRIKGVVPVDVRVEIDTRGRVTSATPVTMKAHSGIEGYLSLARRAGGKTVAL